MTALAAGSLVGCGSDNWPTAAPYSREEVLADGIVSEAEYKAAVDAMVACVEREGFTATAKRRSGEFMWTVSIGVKSRDQGQAAEAVHDRCHAQTLKGVERTFFLAHVPTGAARDAEFAKLVDCLNRVGVPGITPGMAEQQIVREIGKRLGDAQEPGLVCLSAHQVLFPEGMYAE